MTNLDAYKLVQRTEIKELMLTLHEYEHACGARIIHLENEDIENVFCLAFRTMPESDNGLPHILEHIALCGSEKFPLKDPFFVMTRRSLNTYMNALTYADTTVYPAASQIKEDFFNLYEVYLDSVFHPLLSRESFLQEGWRYSFTNPDDIHSPLKYEGIVFNEMKGSSSSRDRRLWLQLNKLLFPDLMYRYDAAGDPISIPTLTLDELKAYHKEYYTPGKCVFYSYGNIPVEEHLAFLEKNTLHDAKPCTPVAPIPLQKRYTETVYAKEYYPSSRPDNQPMITIGWLTMEASNQEEALELYLLDSILMDTDSSPLRKAISDAGVCTKVVTYFDTDMTEVPYYFVLNGCEEGAGKKIEKIIEDAFKKIIEEGISEELAQAALHQLELLKMEITRYGGPFGLSLGLQVCKAALHDASVETPLHVYSRLEEFVQKIQDPDYLPNFIKKYFLDNTHKVVLEMIPSAKLLTEEENAERKQLDEISSKLSQEDRERIKQENADLEEHQKKEITKEEYATLPHLKTEHIPKKAHDIQLIHHETQGVLAPYFHNTFTNHFVYAQLISELPALTEEEFLAAELMVQLLPEMGAGSRNSDQNASLINRYTGGFGSYISIQSVYGDKSTVHPVFAIRGCALSRNKHHLFSILKDFNLSTRFDEKNKIRTEILEYATDLKGDFVSNALGYARGLALSGYSVCNYLHEVMHGTRYYKYVLDLAENIDARLPMLLEQFAMLKEMLFHGHNLDLLVTCDEDDYKEIMENRYYGLDEMPKKSFKPFSSDFVLPKVASGCAKIAAPVAFNASTLNITAAPNLDAAAIHIGTQLMTHRVLHKKIREQGGAYDGGASYSSLTGNFVMHSYRDPNINKTLAAFKEAITSVENQGFDKDHLRAAKLSILQILDEPISPCYRGIVAYNWMHTRRSWEDRQIYRENLMRATSGCVKAAVKKHLSNFSKDATTMIFAGKDLLEKEKVDLPVIDL